MDVVVAMILIVAPPFDAVPEKLGGPGGDVL